MLTIKCTKSCPWGIHHAWGPTFQIEPGMVLTTEEYPADTNAQDWGAFLLTLLKEGQAVQIPNEKVDEIAKETFNNHTNASDAPLNASGGPASVEGDAGDTEDDNTGDQDTENTDESVDGAADDQGGSEGNGGLSATPEATPETLKAELEDIYLKEMDGPVGSEQKAKAALEEIGKRYGIDVDKRKNVDGIIEAIVEAAFKVE